MIMDGKDQQMLAAVALPRYLVAVNVILGGECWPRGDLLPIIICM